MELLLLPNRLLCSPRDCAVRLQPANASSARAHAEVSTMSALLRLGRLALPWTARKALATHELWAIVKTQMQVEDSCCVVLCSAGTFAQRCSKLPLAETACEP